MWALVIKDIALQKRQFIFAALYSLFVFVAFSSSIFSSFVYAMGAIGIAYIMIMTVTSSEEKNDTDIILNSLPLRRWQIVCSKYLSIVVFVGLGLLFMILAGYLFSILHLPAPGPIHLSDIILAFCSVGLMGSIYFPIYYLLAGKWARTINLFLFLLVFFAPSWIVEYVKGHMSKGEVLRLVQLIVQHADLLYLAGLGLILVLMIVSLWVSIRIYERKDF